MRIILITISIICSTVLIHAQDVKTFEDQLPQEKTYTPEEAIDSIHGIEMYERLNHRLAWDSIRNCKGYACEGLIRDYYTDGKILHKGIYNEGQLTGYTNYYPNGQIERYFRIIDDHHSEMNLYYEDGTIKSRHKYKNGTPILWEDHYPNGHKSFYMEMDEGLEYYISKKHWLADGHLLSEMVMTNEKKMLFQQNEYHEDGTPIVKGELLYSHHLYHYYKHGEWKYYENGKVSVIEIYDHDEVKHSKLK